MSDASPASTTRAKVLGPSCVRCSNRKVKCDRQHPVCNACIKHSAECVYRPLPARRKRRKVAEELTPDDRSASVQFPTPASSAVGLEQEQTYTQLRQEHGRSQLINNTLWSRAVEEFDEDKEPFDIGPNETNDADPSDDEEDADFIFGVAPSPAITTATSHPHPPANQIMEFWHIYVDNVDPLTKILHAPTVGTAIEKATQDIAATPKAFEALMFAVYSAAVMTLNDNECREQFGELRKTLLSRYTSTTRLALARAKCTGTTSIIVLQALVIHILSIRDTCEPRRLWTLSGVAIRSAEMMGLNRDGTKLGLPPFEAEIRRRLWWHLKMNDFRTAELCGIAKFRNVDTDFSLTPMPANLNDDQLYPGMTALPEESPKSTDYSFCLLRSELGKIGSKRAATFRQQAKDESLWDYYQSSLGVREKDGFIKEIEEKLETKYLRYCDPSQPLQLMTMMLGRTAIDVGRFIAHHPRRWKDVDQVSEMERKYVWDVSMRLLEQHDFTQSNRQLRRFAWHASYFLQWHAFIHVLETLRANPLMPEAIKAWELVESVYGSHAGIIADTKKTIHRAVGNLCLKAFATREAALKASYGRDSGRTPEYILELRQQRETAKARRQARIAKTRRQAEPSSISQFSMPTALQNSTGGFPEVQAQPCSDPTQTQFNTNVDPFWLTNNGLQGGLADSQMGSNTNAEYMLAQGANMYTGDLMDAPISWEQWDAWLGSFGNVQE